MRKIYVYIQWMLFSNEKEGNPAICNKIDEPRGHSAKWNKPDREREILCDFTICGILKNKSWTHRNRRE